MATASASSRPASPPSGGRFAVFALLGIALLASAIRFGTLSEHSFWLDEAYTVHLVRLHFGSMLREIPRSESTPPLYYIVAWTWTRLFGSGEFALRSLSALAGTATVCVGSLIAGRLGGRRVAVVAGVLIALSPLMVWFSQEARAYALASLMAALSVLCIIAYSDSDRGAWLGGWATCAALGLLTHYFVGFVVLPAVVWLLWGQRRRRAVRIAVAVVSAVTIALIPLALAQRGTGHADYIAHGDLATKILQVPKQFLTGYASPGEFITTPAALALLLIGAAGPLLRGRVRLDTSGRLVLAAGVSGTVLPMILALLGADFLDTRNVLPALVPLTAVVALGFAGAEVQAGSSISPMSSSRVQLPWRLVLGGALAVVGAIVVLLVDTNAAYQRMDWRSASQALGTAARPRAIVVSPGDALLPLQAYRPRLLVFSAPQVIAEIDVVIVQAPRSRGRPLPPAQLSVSVPTGFRLTTARITSTLEVLRYRDPSPQTITLDQLSAIGVGKSRAIVVEKPTHG